MQTYNGNLQLVARIGKPTAFLLLHSSSEVRQATCRHLTGQSCAARLMAVAACRQMKCRIRNLLTTTLGMPGTLRRCACYAALLTRCTGV